ncbi:MAG: hypothetical protein EXR11_06570 [Rhodospirillaceae bacterium]|nr:hypothetical protein [Rhodospirillaceae bacterium]
MPARDRSRFDIILGVALLAATMAGSAAAQTGESAPAGIAFQQRGDGWVLTNAQGMTLYTTLRDVEPDKSSCNVGCVQLWPPLAAADAQGVGDWSVFTRADGTRQWAFRGKPLYTYQRDQATGDGFGEDVGRVWRVAFKPIATPPEVQIFKTSLGQVLTDAKGLTLYTSDKDSAGKPVCNDQCAREWKPVMAPWSAASKGDWSVVTRIDGSKQWAFKGKPLYRYSDDARAGSVLGHDKAGTWHAAVLQPPPPNPSWVKIAQSDAGELYVDARGRTLYQREPPRQRRIPPPAAGTDDDDPFAGGLRLLPDFEPLTVAITGDSKPVGNWSMVEHEGMKQWAYKGLMLYTNARDVKPGDLYGFRGGDRTFHTIMASGEPMQGTGQ